MRIHTAIGDPWSREVIMASLSEASDVSGRTVKDLMSHKRDELTAQARQAAIWDAHSKGVTKATLARFFAKDHTTILHAIRAAGKRAEENAAHYRPPFFKSRRNVA